MPLKANAPMRYDGQHEVVMDAGVLYYHIYVVSTDPGAGEPSDYDVLVAKTAWDSAANNAARVTLVTNAIIAKYRPDARLTTQAGFTFTVP
jgi:hypothetical protein